MSTSIEHIKGDTFVRDLAFTDSNGTAINLTGSSIVFTVKAKKEDTVAVISQTAVITNASGGLAKITINPLDIALGEYYYDIQFTDSTGVITTVVRDMLTITYQITT